MKSKSTWIVIALSVGLLLFAVPFSSVLYTYAVTSSSGNDGGKSSGGNGSVSPSGNDGKNNSGGNGGSVSPSGNDGGRKAPSSTTGNDGANHDEHESEPEPPAIVNNNKVTASDGSVVTSTLPGMAVTEFIQVAATTDEQLLKTQLGLTPSQELVMTAYESGRTQSDAAWTSIWGAFFSFFEANNLEDMDHASELLQVEMSVIEDGQKTVLADNGVTTVRLVMRDTTGRGGAKYSHAMAIRVIEGGEISYLPDLDLDPNTVTIDAPLGNAAYFLVWY